MGINIKLNPGLSLFVDSSMKWFLFSTANAIIRFQFLAMFDGFRTRRLINRVSSYQSKARPLEVRKPLLGLLLRSFAGNCFQNGFFGGNP